MKSYTHNITEFRAKTRHLTHLERAIYRELIDLYYEQEHPFKEDDLEIIERKIMADSPDDYDAMLCVLNEFFVLENGYYYNAECDQVIEAQKLVEK